jgi:phosphopantothenoylcysteine decarboxylase/phosphopantothenate--cysteine ligase
MTENMPSPTHGPNASPGSRPGARSAVRAIVTVGPTHEPIDAVRYIGNRSSGRMGLAIAEALRRAGCEVTVLAGPGVTRLADHPGDWISFRTAGDLARSLSEAWPGHDLLVMAAAVADFRPREPWTGKRRREDGAQSVELVPTQDVLAGLAPFTRPDQYVVGFALEEPAALERSARDKLARKRLDLVVANPIDTMESADVDATVFMADGTARRAAPGRVAKEAFAAWLAGLVVPAAAARAANPR